MDLPIVRHRLQVDCLGMGIGLNESQAFQVSMGSAVISLTYEFDSDRTIPSLRMDDGFLLTTYELNLSIDVPVSCEQRKIWSIKILGDFRCKRRRYRKFRVYYPISFDRSVFLPDL